MLLAEDLVLLGGERMKSPLPAWAISGVTSPGLSLRFLIIWHHQVEPFLPCASFSKPLQN
jgi:hypothetical protein